MKVMLNPVNYAGKCELCKQAGKRICPVSKVQKECSGGVCCVEKWVEAMKVHFTKLKNPNSQRLNNDPKIAEKDIGIF